MFEQETDSETGARMIRYFHQDISKTELEELNQWLQASPENKESFFQLKNIHDVICTHPQLSAEEIEKSWQKMETRIASSTATQPTHMLSKKTVIRSLRYIAVAAVASLLGFIFHHYNTTQHMQPATPSCFPQCSTLKIFLHDIV